MLTLTPAGITQYLDLREDVCVADCYRASGGWTVQVIELAATPTGRDGLWLRVSQYGFWVADVRTPGELEQWFPLAQLEPDDGALSAAA